MGTGGWLLALAATGAAAWLAGETRGYFAGFEMAETAARKGLSGKTESLRIAERGMPPLGARGGVGPERVSFPDTGARKNNRP